MNGWEMKPLGEDGLLLGVHPGFACGEKDIAGGVPHLRMNNISKDGLLEMSLIRRILRDFAEARNRFAEVGDVLFNNTNSTELVGKSCIFTGWQERCAFSNHLTRLRPNPEKLCAEWLFMCLRDLWLQGYFAANCVEFVGQSAFNKDKLLQVKVPVPPLAEQRRLVCRIKTLTGRLEQARQTRRAAHAEAETIEISWLEKIQREGEEKSWLTTALSETAEIMMGQSPKGKTYNLEGQGMPLLNGPTEFGEDHPTARQWTTSPSRFCEAGDILFCVRGSTTGRMNWADQRYCLGRGLAAIRPKGSACLPEYIFGFLKTKAAEILHHGEGGVFPNFNKDQLGSMVVVLPSVEQQKLLVAKFKELRSKLDELQRLQQEVEAELTALVPALLAKAFRGEL